MASARLRPASKHTDHLTKKGMRGKGKKESKIDVHSERQINQQTKKK